jgi:hypothetical protein
MSECVASTTAANLQETTDKQSQQTSERRSINAASSGAAQAGRNQWKKTQ